MANFNKTNLNQRAIVLMPIIKRHKRSTGVQLPTIKTRIRALIWGKIKRCQGRWVFTRLLVAHSVKVAQNMLPEHTGCAGRPFTKNMSSLRTNTEQSGGRGWQVSLSEQTIVLPNRKTALLELFSEHSRGYCSDPKPQFFARAPGLAGLYSKLRRRAKTRCLRGRCFGRILCTILQYIHLHL